MYYFNKELPRNGDLVICKIININELNIIVELLEYDNKKAYISYAELNVKTFYKIKKIYKINMILPLTVTSIENELIYLTTFSNDQHTITEYVNEFNKITKIINFFTYNCNSVEEINNTLRTILHSNEDYKYLIKIFYDDVDELYNISEKWNYEKLYNRIKNVFKPNKRHIVIEYEIKSTKYKGIDDIKNKINDVINSIKKLDNELNINVTFMGSPIYRFIISSDLYNTNKNIMNQIYDSINEIKLDDINLISSKVNIE